MYSSKKKLVAGALVMLVLFGATWVFAAGDEIHACVNPTGKIRIVENSESCLRKEQLLTWNKPVPARKSL